VERRITAAALEEGAIEALGIDHADLGFAIMVGPQAHGPAGNAADGAALVPANHGRNVGEGGLIGEGFAPLGHSLIPEYVKIRRSPRISIASAGIAVRGQNMKFSTETLLGR
jgi:hypothetical protein